MKSFIAILLGFWPVILLAQTSAPRPHSLSLEAQSVANGGEVSASGKAKEHDGPMTMADGGRADARQIHLHDRHETSDRTNLRIDIRNFGTGPDSVRLEWYFVAAPVGGTRKTGSRDFLFDQGSQEVSIPSGVVDTRVVASKEARNAIERSNNIVGGLNPSVHVSFTNGLNAMGHSKQTGVALQGWFVRIVDNGQIIAARGSSDHYEEIAKDDAKLAAFAAESAANHQAHHH